MLILLKELNHCPYAFEYVRLAWN